ncbi:MAG: antibiotic biosynthesis monooxygenase [Streptosporangiales bacterium]|nr:antibiotic biosynthesis monooxygenase [Streptosporangiales bacterium]
MSVVKINAITVPADRREDFEKRFAGRAGMVEHAEGFEHFELLRPSGDDDRYFVYTRWRSEDDFQAWKNSQAFERGHAQAASESAGHGHGHGGPVAASSELLEFEVIQSV